MYGLQGIDLFSPTLPEILLGLLASLCCSFVISLVYRFTYRGPGYSTGYVTSLIVLSLITSLVIMVIGNNLARAFGLVGALSIIRFRTAVKDTIDIVYIFFGLAVGMAAGVGYFKVAAAGTVVIALVLIVASKTGMTWCRGEQFLLQIHSANDDLAPVQKIMEEYCSSYELINVKAAAGADFKEFSYYMSLKRKRNHLAFIQEMKDAGGVLSINLFRDEEHV